MTLPESTMISNAKACYQAGQLTAAISELQQALKQDPTNNWLRTFLFELLCFNGEWERAEKQLKALSTTNAMAEIGVLAYGNNIEAEIVRDKLFSNGLSPDFLLPPPNYITLQLEAINNLRTQNYLEARKLLNKSAKLQPKLNGKVNNKIFKHFNDYNDFFAACLEVFLKDQYIWLPFEQIKRLEIHPPKQLRDLIWAKGIVELVNNSVAEVFLPSLYPHSYKHENELVRLGRVTDWQPLDEDLYLGYGLRTFLIDSQEKTLFEISDLAFEHAESKETL